MRMIPQTVKGRLLLIVAAAGLLVAVLAGGYWIRSSQLDSRALQNRRRGLAAIEAEEYAQALDGLGRYLSRFSRDPQTLYQYAVAREHVELPNRKHLFQAVGILKRLIDLDPDHLKAREKLSHLYRTLGYATETLEAADWVLDRRPDDPAALRDKAVALIRLDRETDALSVARHWNRAAPEDLEGQTLTLSLMRRAETPPERIVARAQKLRENHPEDARFSLLLGIAHRMTDSPEQAAQWFRKAAEQTRPDADYAMQVVSGLNQAGLHQEALSLLNRIGPAGSRIEVRRAWVRRLIQSGQATKVVQALEDLDPDHADAGLLAIKAIALRETRKREQADKIASALARRSDDAAASAWASVLQAAFSPRLEPQAVIDACDQALAVFPANAFFHHYKAEAHRERGETSQAIAAWREAARLAPAWPRPLVRIAEALLELDQPDHAAQAARAALARAPRDVSVLVSLAPVFSSFADQMTDENAQRLLSVVRRIRQQAPEEPRLLSLEIALLVQQDRRREAARTLRETFDQLQSPSQRALLQLADLSRRHELGLEQSIHQRIEKQFGATPPLAYDRALARARENGPQAGLQYLQDARKAAQSDAPDWRLVLARYLQHVGDPRAAEAWAKLGDQNPENRKVQRLILDSSAAWSDTRLIDRTIKRLRALTSDKAVEWRLARARWRMKTNTTKKIAAEAATTLHELTLAAPFRPEPFVLLAQALQRLGNTDGAIDNLSQALERAPDSNSIRLNLARLLQSRDQIDQARMHVNAVAESDNATTAQKRQAAALLARQGEADRAIQLLRALPGEAPGDDASALLLAELYRREGQLEKAEEIGERLLQQKPGLPALRFMAGLLADRDQLDRARTVLRRLDSLDLPPGRAALARARFLQRYASPEAAAEEYRAATEAAPHDPEIWTSRLALLIARDRREELARAIRAAHEACPDDPAFALLARREKSIASLLSRAPAQGLILAILQGSRQRDAAGEALDILAETQTEDQPGSTGSDPAAVRLRRLADRYPQMLPLRTFLIRWYASHDQPAEAAAFAEQTRRAFPDAREPARLAAQVAAAAGQWQQALSAGRSWRDLQPAGAAEADQLIARAQLALNRSEEAYQTLSGYITRLADQPADAYGPMIGAAAQAAARTGRIQQAADLLAPRLALGPAPRAAWIKIAANDLPPREAARWLERAPQHIPGDAPAESAALAVGWYNLAERTGDATQRERARSILADLAARPGVDARTTLALAITAERQGDLPAAQAAYEQALQLDADLPMAANNLAMILIQAGDAPDRAVDLASRAVKARPRTAAFRDTLAQALTARGRTEDAIEQMRRAVQLEPGRQPYSRRLEDLRKKAESPA